ncbi:MAG TPA: POTRA domain-containing protein, partial [Candidatus Krumholzibacteria bacterium]|nr:POTRA domain-containing protein [Candidatus Krumholzibacteria bacterium]
MTAAVFWPVAAHSAKVECEIVGVSDPEVVENIEATLSIVRDQDRDDLTAERISRLHERAPTEIQKAVEPFGFYRAVVEGSLTPGKKDRFRARYVVTLGEPVRVQEVSVSVTGDGKDAPPFPALVARFPLGPGDVLDQRLYSRAKTTFASTAADSGYLDATFTASTIRIHREENVADVEIAFDTGPQYRFGAVVFDSTAIDDRVLRAYVTFKRGDPFRYSKLLRFQSALGGAPYFSRVEAVARRDIAVNHEVPIQVKLALRRPRRYEVGVGYGTDTGPRILFNAEFRRLNRVGHHYRGKLNVSEVELSLYADYVMPSLYPKTHTYTIGALAARIDPDAYTTDRFAIGPTRSQPRLGWLESITLSYEWEDYTVGSDEGTTDLVIAGLSYRYKRADDDIAPTHGHRLDLGLRGAGQDFLSTQSFLSLTGSV